MKPVMFNGMIGRTQDFSQIQQNEVNKPVVDQQNFAMQTIKQAETKAEQVNKNENSEMQSQYDAKREGKGQYQEQKDRKRQDEHKDGTVTIKKSAGFDIKI